MESCEFRVLPIHVHGHRADIEAFFAAIEEKLAEVERDIPALYPSIEIIPPEEE